MYLSNYLLVYLSTYISNYLLVYLSTYRSKCLSVQLSLPIFRCRSVYGQLYRIEMSAWCRRHMDWLNKVVHPGCCGAMVASIYATTISQKHILGFHGWRFAFGTVGFLSLCLVGVANSTGQDRQVNMSKFSTTHMCALRCSTTTPRRGTRSG